MKHISMMRRRIRRNRGVSSTSIHMDTTRMEEEKDKNNGKEMVTCCIP
jgi:hypothetical protein